MTRPVCIRGFRQRAEHWESSVLPPGFPASRSIPSVIWHFLGGGLFHADFTPQSRSAAAAPSSLDCIRGSARVRSRWRGFARRASPGRHAHRNSDRTYRDHSFSD
jgi:hypothetical protein